MSLIRLLGACCFATFAVAQEATLPLEMAFAPLPSRAADPEDNPSSPAKVALGRLLFFDPILSATKTIACATCHQPALGWADGRALAMGIEPLKRNTLTVLNVGFNTGGR